MARPLRIEYPGAFYHITTRGVGRQDIFFDEADKQMFLKKLEEVQEKWGLVVRGKMGSPFIFQLTINEK